MEQLLLKKCSIATHAGPYGCTEKERKGEEEGKGSAALKACFVGKY